MNSTGLIIVVVALVVSVAVGVISHGHVLFVALPLVLGFPFAGLMGRRK